MKPDMAPVALEMARSGRSKEGKLPLQQNTLTRLGLECDETRTRVDEAAVRHNSG